MSAQAQHKEPHGKQWEHYTDMPVGEILRRARVHYGQSLDDVEAVLRIRAAQLGALETGKVDDLPGRVYAIGFVRAYAEYLGLDGDKMVHLFKLQSVGSKSRPELNFPVAASESKLPGLFLLGMSLGAVVLIVVLFSMFHTRHSASIVERIPAVSAQLRAEAQAPLPKVLPAPVQAAAPTNTTVSVMAAASALPTASINTGTASTAPARIVIHVTDTTWMEIRNSSGKALISQVLSPGDTYLVPNEQGLVLATGNIGGLAFVVDGQALPLLGNKGDVARGIKLDPEQMKPGAAKAMPQAASTAVVYQPSAQTQSQAQPVTAQLPTTTQPAPVATGQTSPAWQSSIRPAAQAQGTPAATQPVMPQYAAPAAATTTATTQSAAARRRHIHAEDQAYRPPTLPGAASGSTGYGGEATPTDSWTGNTGQGYNSNDD